jgi:polyisoprenoid-binding protein YceI
MNSLDHWWKLKSMLWRSRINIQLGCLLLLAFPSNAQKFALSESSVIKFEITHLGVLTVDGKFQDFKGEFIKIKNRWNVIVSIKASSIDTGNRDRDANIRAAQYLDVEKFPDLTYKATGVETADSIMLDGNLTIKQTSSRLQLNLTRNGRQFKPISFTISRKHFGLDFGPMNDLIGDEIKVTANPELIVRQNLPSPAR